MGLLRLDSVGILVDDLDAVASFFLGMGFVFRSEATESAKWLEKVTGVPGAKLNITMLQSPQAETHIELIQYDPPVKMLAPDAVTVLRPGPRMLTLLVEDLAESTALALALGAQAVSDGPERLGAFEISYVIAPGNILVMLAEDVAWDEL